MCESASVAWPGLPADKRPPFCPWAQDGECHDNCVRRINGECADVAKVQVLIGIRELLASLAHVAREQLDIDKAILERGGYDDIRPDADLAEALKRVPRPPCNDCRHFDTLPYQEPCLSCLGNKDHPSFEPGRCWDDEPDDACEDQHDCETCRYELRPSIEEPCVSCSHNAPNHWRPRGRKRP